MLLLRLKAVLALCEGDGSMHGAKGWRQCSSRRLWGSRHEQAGSARSWEVQPPPRARKANIEQGSGAESVMRAAPILGSGRPTHHWQRTLHTLTLPAQGAKQGGGHSGPAKPLRANRGRIKTADAGRHVRTLVAVLGMLRMRRSSADMFSNTLLPCVYICMQGVRMRMRVHARLCTRIKTS